MTDICVYFTLYVEILVLKIYDTMNYNLILHFIDFDLKDIYSKKCEIHMVLPIIM